MQAKPSTRHRYQDQASQQTLAEGLAEYYVANQGIITRPDDLPAESFALFRSHDICHVVFGLDTSLADETIVDTRTLLSCDVGVRRYLKYLSTDKEAKALFADLGAWRAVWATMLALPRIVRAMYEALRVPKKWPWTPPQSYLARSLEELRREFRIRVI
jgi:hypothetical protein